MNLARVQNLPVFTVKVCRWKLQKQRKCVQYCKSVHVCMEVFVQVCPGSRWPEDNSSVFLAWADLNSLHIELLLIIFWALSLTLDVLHGEKSWTTTGRCSQDRLTYTVPQKFKYFIDVFRCVSVFIMAVIFYRVVLKTTFFFHLKNPSHQIVLNHLQ